MYLIKDMGLKSTLSKPFAAFAMIKVKRWKNDPHKYQAEVFKDLIKKASKTQFGKDHDFKNIKTYKDFIKRVPVRDYEELKPYIEKIKAGEGDVLWPGQPIYFCKTSGTTSGAKYIPLTRDSLPNHIGSARNALLSYINETGKSGFTEGKMIFLQGSPVLDETANIPTGRLSGIVAHHVPAYLQKNRLPSFETNSIEDWESKVERIVDETINEDMTLISGIPSWVQFYFEKLRERSGGKPIKDIFPNFKLFVYGGVNFKPYESRFEELIGRKTDSIELFPASEGFIAFQDSQKEEGLLLTVNDGIFYEFIPADEYFNENPTRLCLEDVEMGKSYALIINSNAGLWGYSIGDTVKFVSKDPYRLVVSGRIKHFTSAFGEHVIAEEVEFAMIQATSEFNADIIEFTVAPQTNPAEGLPYHEWLISFAREPQDMEKFALRLDELMQKKNSYYYDLLIGKILKPLVISTLQKDAFNNYMKSVGKLGGQNKVPRLSNDRNIADQLLQWKV